MTSVPGRFEEVEHTADTALRVHGKRWEDLLVNAAVGMFSLIAEWEGSAVSAEREMALRAADRETLLVDWLSELLYHSEVEGLVYVEFDILDASPNALHALARGTDQWTPQRIIKAVTFNALRVTETPEGYTTTIVFDT